MDTLKKYQSDLDNYPSFHKHSNEWRKTVLKTESDIKITIDKINNEISSDKNGRTVMENSRDHNLLSHLYFLRNDRSKVDEHIEGALEIDEGNIITLTGQAYFYLEYEEKFSEVEGILKKIHKLNEERHRVLQAHAEIEYGYCRMGAKFYHNSVSRLEKIIADAETLIAPPSAWKTSICIWNFGLALAKGRLLSLSNLTSSEEIDLSDKNYKRVIDILFKITNSENNENVDRVTVYKARAYAEIGSLTLIAESNVKEFPNGLNDILPEYEKEFDYTSLTYIEQALKVCDNDAYVLLKCGKYFRRVNNIQRAVELYQRALKFNQTSSAHEHIALLLKRKLEIDILTKGFESKNPVHDRRSKNSHLYKVIKSPKEVLKIDKKQYKRDIKDIFHHFNEALKSPNRSALYSKGLFLRQIGDIKEAYDTFKKLIFDKNDGKCSLMHLANAYEQAANCIMEFKRNEHYKEEMFHYLKRSLEISSDLVAKIPSLESCWTTAPTLKSLLKREAQTKQTQHDLAFLYDKLQSDKSIKVYQDLLNILEEPGEKLDVILRMISTQVKLGDYDGSILAFNLIACLPDGRQKLEVTEYIEVHIEGCLQAFEQGEYDVAKVRVKNALQFIDKITDLSVDRRDETASKDMHEEFDVFLLCDDNDDKLTDHYRYLRDHLQLLGISVTINSTDVRPGFTLLKGVTDVMEASKHFVIALKDRHPSREFEQRVAMVQEVLKSRARSYCIVLSSCELPVWLTGSPVIMGDDVISLFCEDIRQMLGNPRGREILKQILLHLCQKKRPMDAERH
ncbi:hypothetical protein DPMN_171035 [Dreissena polymorpha]|uniref:TIR domain-containing protein n=1 Tax=Dreissena polymorpha TaxID=45954 RepID=A0A9D4IDT2_DREPO|nr:hypothetical protein DPMN_171035 [Dreissena polymorpha]